MLPIVGFASIAYYPKTKIVAIVGSTNLNKGILEIFRIDKSTKEEQINQVLASSSIPIVFKPVMFNNKL